MTRETMARIRLLSEKALETNFNTTGGRDLQIIATFEVARQIAILSDEMHRMNKKNDELVACLKGIALRMEAKDAG